MEDFFHPFAEDGKITLVVHKDYAGFQVARQIADLINGEMAVQSGGVAVAKALDQVNVEVTVSPAYADSLVDFVSQILSLEMLDDLPIGPRVVICERSGTVVIHGDVEIGPVLITHKNIVVETGETVAASHFVPVDSTSPENPKLKSLLAALDAIQVPAQDVVEIIKQIQAAGSLYAQLIVK